MCRKELPPMYNRPGHGLSSPPRRPQAPRSPPRGRSPPRARPRSPPRAWDRGPPPDMRRPENRARGRGSPPPRGDWKHDKYEGRGRSPPRAHRSPPRAARSPPRARSPPKARYSILDSRFSVRPFGSLLLPHHFDVVWNDMSTFLPDETFEKPKKNLDLLSLCHK